MLSRLSDSEDTIDYARRRREGRANVMTRLTVAAGAEWVSAPMEMRSAPAAAIALTFLSVIPPDTSTRACFLISTTARRTMSGTWKAGSPELAEHYQQGHFWQP